MQTALTDFIRTTAAGREAEAILRACVHCGFCNATCPTYQLLGDELDGPRGRIYLIKEMLEGAAVTRRTRTHLDRCLTCRNCETTCPSGVEYGRLLDIGRDVGEHRLPRSWPDRLARWALRRVVPYPARFTPLLRLGQWLRPLLPARLKHRIPAYRRTAGRPTARHARTMLLLEGCVQPAIAPGINAAAARVLDKLGVSLPAARAAGCCGALCHHTSGVDEGRAFARRAIDAWWPHIEAGIEAIVTTASGCGVHVKDYGSLLEHDPAYAAKAARVAELTMDIGEILANEDLAMLRPGMKPGIKVAFQSPCTLQHGQRLNGVVEKLLGDLGFMLTPVPEAHSCCGSAGSYALLQPEISRRLREKMLAALGSGRPDVIATANIGCLTQLQQSPGTPVVHWVELLDS